MTYLANNLPSNEATTSFTQEWQQSFENFFHSLGTIFCNSNTQEFNKNKSDRTKEGSRLNLRPVKKPTRETEI